MNDHPKNQNLTYLRLKLTELFSEDELRILCFDLQIDYDEIDGANKSSKVVELLLYLSRRQSIDKLIETCKKLRPLETWSTLNMRPKESIQESYSKDSFAQFNYKFIGREKEIHKLLDVLETPSKASFLAITGLGGIGKTALARQLAYLCSNMQIFNKIIWTSAKSEHLVGDQVISSNEQPYTMEYLIDEITQQCGWIPTPNIDSSNKIQHIKHLFKTTCILIILDNLESTPNAEELLSFLSNIIGLGKVIYTSRHIYQLYDSDTYHFALSGMSLNDSINLLKEIGLQNNIQAIKAATHNQLKQIHEITGGAPLAMKLVAGQTLFIDIQEALEYLKRASYAERDSTFYRFIYMKTWRLLNDAAHYLLVELASFNLQAGGEHEVVKRIFTNTPVINDLAINSRRSADDLFLSALIDLKRFSLIEEKFSRQWKYSSILIHPLTQYFILSDITGEWDAEFK